MASMTTVRTSTPASKKPEEAAGFTPWKIYDTIMTPINLITFIISLYLVDNRYQAQRARGQYHHQSQNHNYFSKMIPTWLHALLFRPQPQLQPYEWVGGNNNPSPSSTSSTTSSSSPSTIIITSNNTNKKNNSPQRRPTGGMRRTSRGEERWYYHTQQKRLLRMEAADAFELRGAVLLGLAGAAAAALGAAWWVLGVLARVW